jgi:hypothetical protein
MSGQHNAVAENCQGPSARAFPFLCSAVTQTSHMLCCCRPTILCPSFRFSESDDPEPSCLAYNDEDSCLQHDCGWCSNSGVLGASIEGCVSESIAKLVPKVRPPPLV